MKTADDYLEELQANGALTRKSYTRKEYIYQLEDFCKAVNKVVAEDDRQSSLSISISKMKQEAKFLGIVQNPDVAAGMDALREIAAEYNRVFSGNKAETKVKNEISKISENDIKIFYNMEVFDYTNWSNNKTEIDAVILTYTGIILVEVKSSKGDVHIDKKGRLVRGKSTCFEGMSFVRNMMLKEKLLRENISFELEKRGIIRDIAIDKVLVVSSPTEAIIDVRNASIKLDACKVPEVANYIINHRGGVIYTKEDMEAIEAALTSISKIEKSYPVNLNYSDLRKKIACAEFAIYKTKYKEYFTSVEGLDKKIEKAEALEAKEKLNSEQFADLRAEKTKAIDELKAERDDIITEIKNSGRAGMAKYFAIQTVSTILLAAGMTAALEWRRANGEAENSKNLMAAL